MYSRFLSAALLLWLPLPVYAAAGGVLRVCADPNNLPFSNQAEEGFENRIAEIVARDLGAKLEYVWWSERKSFLKTSLNENRCDAVMGVPDQLDSVLVTRPYYRSTYVFVSRADRNLNLTSLADPRLSEWKIGIHVVGDDYAPPAQALGHRGLSANFVAYSLFGAYGEPNPPSKIISGVTRGEVDVAIVWGPFAGYFGRRADASLAIAPVTPSTYFAVPFTFAISAAVRKGDVALLQELDEALSRNCQAIRSILTEYGVPRAPEGNPSCDPQPPPSASSH